MTLFFFTKLFCWIIHLLSQISLCHTISTSLALDLLAAITVSTLFPPLPVRGLPLHDTPNTYLLLHQLVVSSFNHAATDGLETARSPARTPIQACFFYHKLLFYFVMKLRAGRKHQSEGRHTGMAGTIWEECENRAASKTIASFFFCSSLQTIASSCLHGDPI